MIGTQGESNYGDANKESTLDPKKFGETMEMRKFPNYTLPMRNCIVSGSLTSDEEFDYGVYTRPRYMEILMFSPLMCFCTTMIIVIFWVGGLPSIDNTYHPSGFKIPHT